MIPLGGSHDDGNRSTGVVGFFFVFLWWSIWLSGVGPCWWHLVLGNARVGLVNRGFSGLYCQLSCLYGSSRVSRPGSKVLRECLRGRLEGRVVLKDPRQEAWWGPGVGQTKVFKIPFTISPLLIFSSISSLPNTIDAHNYHVVASQSTEQCIAIFYAWILRLDQCLRLIQPTPTIFRSINH